MSPHRIIETVAQITGVPSAAIMGLRRTNRVAHARFLCIAAIAHAHPSWSLSDVGDVFHLDHSTVIHARKRHAQLVAMNSRYHAHARRICKSLFCSPA